jgi:SAM-dependent methyltransferase
MASDPTTQPAVADAAAVGFGANAVDYERSRPTYPDEAVDQLRELFGVGPGVRVLDLAAGTGKLTRLLVAAGAEVVAVEPVAAMREQLEALVARAGGGAPVEVLEGTAESIPLPGASVEVVTIAQAFHWFEPGPALAEVHRVLRPGGGLALLWNTRDRSVDWVRAFGEILWAAHEERPYDSYHDVDHAAVVADAGGFTPLQEWSCDWQQPFDEDLLVSRAASVSVVGTLPPGERAVVLEQVRQLCRTHPDLAGRPEFGFPYTTRLFWCRRV